MPKNKPILIYASCVAFVAAAAHLIRPTCPATAAAEDSVVTDPRWGIVQNLDATKTPMGVQFTATAKVGRHRVLQSFKSPAAGRYQISVDTRYVGTSHLAIEAGGPHQPYGLVEVNLKNGTIEKIKGDVAAGVDPVNAQPGQYHWWIEMPFNGGEADYNFALLSAKGQADFPGSGICRVVLSNPSAVPVANTQTK